MGKAVISAVISAVIAYLLGSINTSIIVSKLIGADDIRSKGSGNAGATNTLRILGKKAAAFVVLGDGLKGVAAILFARFIEKYIFGIPDSAYSEYAAAVFVMIGHVFPVFFGFKGGKGIMTSIAVIFMLDPRIGGILLAVFVAVVICSNHISLGSVVSAVCFPISVIFLHTGDKGFIFSSVIIAVIAVLKHKTNMVRLIHGEESKFIKH